MSSTAVKIEFDPPVRWLLARMVVALGVIIASAGSVPRWATAAGLVACVWLDALAGWCSRRGQRPAPFAAACEVLADFVCFIWAPVAWITAAGASAATWTAAGLFVLAGIYRLARFQAEGLVRGGYRGLPVTYMGYLVPAIGAVVGLWLPQAGWAWPAALPLLSWAMVSTRFVVPEF